ncbi:MAG: metallophosphoesterase [Actinomycetota bacterium]
MPWSIPFVAAALAFLYGALVERRWYRLVRRRLDILPADASGPLTVLHLSDLHVTRGERRLGRFLASLPAADVTVVTGDLVGEPEGVEHVVELLRPTRGRLASWFVLGSNDYYAPRFRNPLRYLVPHRRRRSRSATRGRAGDLVACLVEDGWRDLTNARDEVALGTLPVELLGLDDAHIFRHDLRVAPRRARERFGIAVMHSPDSAPECAALGYDLLVAGHTHGGQVGIPFVGALVTNSAMPPRLAKGIVRIGDAVLSLSPGLGTSKYAPFRFAVRPEAMLLELRPRRAGA